MSEDLTLFPIRFMRSISKEFVDLTPGLALRPGRGCRETFHDLSFDDKEGSFILLQPDSEIFALCAKGIAHSAVPATPCALRYAPCGENAEDSTDNWFHDF